MTLAMTVVVGDDADVLESHLDFHLNAGVDVVIVWEKNSSSPTAEILDRYAREGSVHVTRDTAPEGDDDARALAMARTAMTEYGAEWVIASTPSEFWWPRSGSLKEVLEPIPSEYAIVQAFVRHFVPVPDGTSPFSERMIYRLSPHAPVHDPASPWRPASTFVRRAVAVDRGEAQRSAGRILRGWYPIEVLHFPIRSVAQLGGRKSGVLPVNPSDIERGLAEGVLQIDTRLREALRAHASGKPFELLVPGVVDDVLYAVDAAVLGEADVLKAKSDMDDLEQRLHAIERYLAVRFERKLRSFARGVLRRP